MARRIPPTLLFCLALAAAVAVPAQPAPGDAPSAASATDTPFVLPPLPPGMEDSLPLVPSPGASIPEAAPEPVPDTLAVAAAADSAARIRRLTLQDAIGHLLRRNSDVAKARQAWLAAGDRAFGAWGVYEPSLVGSWNYERTGRPYLLLDQSQAVYTGGVEGFLPTATRYNVGFSFTDLSHKFLDNVQRPGAFAGVTVTQPLLQGLWFGKPWAEIMAAKSARTSALHRYRSTLSAAIGEARGSYWKLRHAQDKARFAAQSVAMARELVADSRLRFRVGKNSAVDTVEAAAGLASREMALSSARIELNAAMSELRLLLADGQDSLEAPIEATSPLSPPPRAWLDTLASTLLIDSVLLRQPDYLEKKSETAKQKVVYKSQMDQWLPELNLKGTVGYQVSGTSTDAVWDRVWDNGYRGKSNTYTAGVELRMPILLNLKERSLASAERRTLRQAEIDERSTRIQLEDYLALSRKRLISLRSNIDNAAIVVDFRRTLLNAEIRRQSAGKSDYHKIFEMEEELTKARLSETENSVEFMSTLGQLQRLAGSSLSDLGLETFEGGKPVLDESLTVSDPPRTKDLQ